jgi:hypothetical protein
VSSALDRSGFAIVSTAMHQCLVTDEGAAAPADQDAPPARNLTIEEVEKLFLPLS